MNGELLGLGVVGYVIADYVVATVTAQPGPVEELDAVRATVVFDSFRFTFNVLVKSLALLAEGCEISCRDTKLESLGILADGYLVCANSEGSLREDDLAIEYCRFLRIVG